MGSNPTTQTFRISFPSNIPAYVASGSVAAALNFLPSVGLADWNSALIQGLAGSNWSAAGVSGYAVANAHWEVTPAGYCALAWDMQTLSDPIDAVSLAAIIVAAAAVIGTIILTYLEAITLSSGWYGVIVVAALVIIAGTLVFSSPAVTSVLAVGTSLLWIFGAAAAVGTAFFLYDFVKGGSKYRRGVYRTVGSTGVRAAGAIGRGAGAAAGGVRSAGLELLKSRERSKARSEKYEAGERIARIAAGERVRERRREARRPHEGSRGGAGVA